MIKIAIQTFKNSGHSGRGVGVYGEKLVNELKHRHNDLEILEFSQISELRNKNVSLVHFLTFDLFQRTLDAGLEIPFIVTIHDLTPLVFSEHFPSGFRGSVNLFFQKRSLQKAKKIITVSEASKKDILTYLKVAEEKIEVIYSGVGEEFRKITEIKDLERVKQKYHLPDQFAFYSGNVNWNKNILNMTRACVDAGLDLVIVGKSFKNTDNLDHPELKSFKQFLAEFGTHPKVHLLGYVQTEDMVCILNQAILALFVSYYEGFGFPILEAQSCGVPVITSESSSMPEIAGKGALFVDPKNTLEIQHSIEKILGDDKLKSKLIDDGLENVKRFSWTACATETVRLYKSVL